jgi:hypothetical protein
MAGVALHATYIVALLRRVLRLINSNIYKYVNI